MIRKMVRCMERRVYRPHKFMTKKIDQCYILFSENCNLYFHMLYCVSCTSNVAKHNSYIQFRHTSFAALNQLLTLHKKTDFCVDTFLKCAGNKADNFHGMFTETSSLNIEQPIT